MGDVVFQARQNGTQRIKERELASQWQYIDNFDKNPNE